jgi:hypothetical protein
MIKTLLLAGSATFVLLAAGLIGSSAQAGTLIPVVPVAGSTGMTVFGINDNNIIVGSYTDANGVEHGYFGPLDGSNYTTFSYKGNKADGTQPRSINNENYVAGYAPATNEGLLSGYEFVRNPGTGKITTIEKNHVPLDGVAQGITVNAISVGDYWNAPDNTVRFGYEAVAGKYKHDITLPVDTTRAAPRGINSTGDIAGFYDPSATSHGFVIQNGVFSTIDYPDASEVSTGLEGINDNGLVTGGWGDSSGNFHAFTLDLGTSTFTHFDVKGATVVQLFGLNNSGFIAVDTDTGGGAFIYCPMKKKKCPSNGQAISLGTPIHMLAEKGLLYNVKAAQRPSAQTVRHPETGRLVQ